MGQRHEDAQNVEGAQNEQDARQAHQQNAGRDGGSSGVYGSCRDEDARRDDGPYCDAGACCDDDACCDDNGSWDVVACGDVNALTPKELGNLGELLAASYLSKRGYEILEHNYRCPEGEADLIAYDPAAEMIVLVEVKTRRVRMFADEQPEEAVDARKRARYRRIAGCYLMDRFPVMSMRFDAIGVQVKGEHDARIAHYFDVFAWEADR